MSIPTRTPVESPVHPPIPGGPCVRRLAQLFIALAAAYVLAAFAFAPAASAAAGDFIISGRGYGHGEGMSQWGAWEAAREGVKYDAILAFYYPGTTLTTISPAQLVKVRLTHSSNSSACYYRVDLHPTVTLATLVMHDSAGDHTTSLEPGTVVETLYSAGKVQVVGTTGTFDWVELRPASDDGRVALSLWASSTSAAYAIEYWGTLRVEPNASATSLRLYDTLLLDRYVRSVSEIDPGWANSSLPTQYAPECVKAQQTAARTYALAHGSTSDLYDNTNDQVYAGYTWEATHPGVVAAADATAGMVITYAGKPISANFSTSSGGYLTESAWSDNAGIPYLVAKPDPWSLKAPVSPWAAGPGYPWTYTVSPAGLASRLGVSVGTITGLEVTARDTSDPTSHARTMLISGTTGSTTMSARTFKSKLGLKSTLILSIAKDSTTARYDQTNTNIVKTGTWKDYGATGSYLGTYGRSSTSGAKATIYFTGTKIAWIGMKGTTPGIVDVYLDDVKKATLDLYAASPKYQVTLWTSDTLANTAHHLDLVRATASKTTEFIVLDAVEIWGTITAVPPTINSVNPSSGSTSGSTSVTINGNGFTGLTGASAVTFGGVNATSYTVNSATKITAVAPAHAAGTVRVQVTATGGATPDTSADDYTYSTPVTSTRYDQTNKNIVKTGTWKDFGATGSYLGTYGRSSTSGAKATIYFTGTKIAWIGMKGTTPGIVDVYLDDVKKATLDLYAASPKYQVTLWTSDTLANTAHHLDLVRATASKTTEFIVLDAVEIWGTITAR